MARVIEAGKLAQTAEEVDLPWRVISLLNIFRLLAPMVLLLVFFFNAPNYTIGGRLPGMFLGICAAWFSVGLVSIRLIHRRWPAAHLQALVLLVIDTIAVALLIHSSGGMSSGLANLLVLPAGATATIVRPRLALAATAFIVIALLFEALIAGLSGFGTTSHFVVAGLTGASLFAITLLALPMANRLRESEARVQQRDLDLANLSELNEFIVQHLRESILVVDAEDRIRLINETASRLLKGEKVLHGELLGEVSPRLLYLLETWRRQESDRRDTVAEVVSADGGTVIQPQFVSLSQHGPGPVLIFLEDTSQMAERVQQSKLAALGRLSASIAHEIRNPVGAMSHASQLLRESPAIGSDDKHLTDIIEKNAVRVSQIIDTVLELSRRDKTRQERLQLDAWLETLANEFRDTLQLAPERLRLTSDLPTRAGAIRSVSSAPGGVEPVRQRGQARRGRSRRYRRAAGRARPDQRPALPGSGGSRARASMVRTRSGSSSPFSPTALAGRGSGSSSRASSARPMARCCCTSRGPAVAACSA